MAKFKMGVGREGVLTTARLGATGAKLVDNDRGKFVKLAAESEFDLCAAGDPIEGQVISLESATQDNFAIGSVKEAGEIAAICDGLEATPGTGVIAAGDYVVCGTVVAGGTALTSATGPKVTKATNQPGTAIVSTVATADTAAAVKVALDAVLVLVADAENNVAKGLWRVVSLGVAGAVGDTCVLKRVMAPKAA